MSCENWKEHLVARLYGELEPADEELFSAHLEACSDCRRDLAELAEVREALRETQQEVPAAPRVVVVAPRRFARIPSALAASLAGLALIAGVAGGWWLGVRGGPLDRKVASEAGMVAAPAHLEGVLAERIRQERDALQQWVLAQQETRLRQLLERSKPPPAITTEQLRSALARLEQNLDSQRAADLEYLLGQIAGLELRTDARIGETRQALQYFVLARDPRLSEQ